MDSEPVNSGFFENCRRPLVALFFVGYLAIGLFAFKDYGVHWDYVYNRQVGAASLVCYERLPCPPLQERGATDTAKSSQGMYGHGPAFEMFLLVLERAFGLTDPRSTVLMQHAVTFLFFYLAVIIFYRLCLRFFKNWKYALAGSLFLILNPRIFAHSFYNTVDIPFLSMFVLSIYTMLRFFDRKNWLNALAHAFACGILTDIRLAGLLVVFLTLEGIVSDWLREKNRAAAFRQMLFPVLLYLIFTLKSMTAFWPFLWDYPSSGSMMNFQAFLEALRASSQHDWTRDVLYWGRMIPGKEVPWHYNFSWILITVPWSYTFLFLIGFLSALWCLGRPTVNRVEQRDRLIVLLWFTIPLFIPLLRRTTLFDDWRHHYFIYPAIVILMLEGIRVFTEGCRKMRRPVLGRVAVFLLIGLTGLNLAETAWSMVKNHPYQDVYFNVFAGKGLRQKFDLDYWGLSYRYAFESLLMKDKRKQIKVHVPNISGEVNRQILKREDRPRLLFTSLEDADYFVTEFRWHPEDYPYDEYFSILVNGEKVAAVYRLK